MMALSLALTSVFTFFFSVCRHKLQLITPPIPQKINVNPLTFYQVAHSCDSQFSSFNPTGQKAQTLWQLSRVNCQT